MSTHGHPIVDAAWRELCAIHHQTGGGDGLRPNQTPEYEAALRVFGAVLEAHRSVVHDRISFRRGERSLRVVRWEHAP